MKKGGNYSVPPRISYFLLEVRKVNEKSKDT